VHRGLGHNPHVNLTIENAMTTSDPAGKPQSPAAQGGQDARSDKLLPTGGKAGDGLFDVAEEVNLDQQSDTARRVGEASAGSTADAVAESLRRNDAGKPGQAQK
jgi:hypothetical protein